MNKKAQVLALASDAIMKIAQERDSALEEQSRLQNRLDQLELRLTCEKVAADMHSKGLERHRDFVELVEDLEKEAQAGRLPVIEEAVRISAPAMGAKIAFINDDDDTSVLGASQLEQYLAGSIG